MIDRLVLPLLVAGCAVFGAILIAELQAKSPADEAIARVAAQPEAMAAVHRPQNPGFEELVATTLARPLFSSTRRPPQNAAPGSASDGDLADKRLTGIVIAPGERFAIFAVTGDKPLRVSEGEDVSGWKIESITLREVSLTGPGGTKVLQPKLDPNLVPPAPVANAAGRIPNPPPAMPRPPVPLPAAGQPNPAVPLNMPGVPPRPVRLRPQR